MVLLYVTCNYDSVQTHLMEAFESEGVSPKVFHHSLKKGLNNSYPDFASSYKYPFFCRTPLMYAVESWLALRKCYRLYKKSTEIDVIHGNMVFKDGMICRKLSKKLQIPYVLSVRDTDINKSVFWKMPWTNREGILALDNAKAIICLSKPYKEKILSKVPAEVAERIRDKIHIVPNGIDKFYLNNKCNRSVTFEDRINLIFVGRVMRRKNIELIVEAMKKIESQGVSITLTIIGKIVDLRYQQLIDSNKCINYYPEMAKENIVKHMREADIFVMPSHTETFGLVYAEAMSQGLPVIYTRGQGFDGHFPDGTVGYATSDTDSDELVKNIMLAWKNHNVLSNNCIQMVGRFDWEKIAQKLLTIY